MGNNPTDIANFNLIEWAKIQGNLFSSNPMTLTVPQKDANGNIVDFTIQNRGKFQQAVWDDMGSALGQMERTFHVDSENGADSNDGSENNPFRSLKKACDSVPVGGFGNIKIISDMIFENDFTEIHLTNKSVYIEIRGVFNVQYKIKGNIATPCLQLKLYNSHITFYIQSNANYAGSFIVENKVENATHSDSFIIPEKLKGGSSGCSFYILNHIDNHTIFMLDKSILIKLSVWGISSCSEFSLEYSSYSNAEGNSFIFKNNSKLVDLSSSNISFSALTTNQEIDESGNRVELKDLFTGIIRDTNGVPRNIQSNIIL